MRPPPAIRIHIATIGFLCLVAAFVKGVPAAETGATMANGKALFQERCSSCHTIGGGRLVGPDLKGVTASRQHDWLERFISAPSKVIASGDPIANQLLKQYGGVRMPDLGLSPSQVEALLNFLSEGKGQAAQPPPAAQAPTAGNAVRGEDYFTGVMALQKGGAPCLACHSLAGVAPLGGGVVGPDLTGIYSQFGAAGLTSVLATLPFPTMKPIYQSHPLTRAEQEDLLALFQSAAGRKPSNAVGLIVGAAFSGAILFILLAGVIWRKRLHGVRIGPGRRN